MPVIQKPADCCKCMGNKMCISCGTIKHPTANNQSQLHVTLMHLLFCIHRDHIHGTGCIPSDGLAEAGSS